MRGLRHGGARPGASAGCSRGRRCRAAGSEVARCGALLPCQEAQAALALKAAGSDARCVNKQVQVLTGPLQVPWCRIRAGDFQLEAGGLGDGRARLREHCCRPRPRTPRTRPNKVAGAETRGFPRPSYLARCRAARTDIRKLDLVEPMRRARLLSSGEQRGGTGSAQAGRDVRTRRRAARLGAGRGMVGAARRLGAIYCRVVQEATCRAAAARRLEWLAL